MVLNFYFYHLILNKNDWNDNDCVCNVLFWTEGGAVQPELETHTDISDDFL